MSQIELNKKETEDILTIVFDLLKKPEEIVNFKFDQCINYYSNKLVLQYIEYKPQYRHALNYDNKKEYIMVENDMRNGTINITIKDKR